MFLRLRKHARDLICRLRIPCMRFPQLEVPPQCELQLILEMRNFRKWYKVVNCWPINWRGKKKYWFKLKTYQSTDENDKIIIIYANPFKRSQMNGRRVFLLFIQWFEIENKIYLLPIQIFGQAQGVYILGSKRQQILNWVGEFHWEITICFQRGNILFFNMFRYKVNMLYYVLNAAW